MVYIWHTSIRPNMSSVWVKYANQMGWPYENPLAYL